MRNFSDEQGRTRVFVEAYRWYSADGNPRRTPLIGKRAIYGWKLTKSMASELVRLSDYTIEAPGNEDGLRNFNLVFSKGDAFSIVTDSSDDAHHLLRGVAALDAPKSGRFLYKGEEIDFSDYRNLLHYKRNVGYVASDAIFLANRSIHDNLMLMRHYFEDSTRIEMCTEAVELCRVFDLEKRLNLKPHQLDPEEHRLFVIVRELSKNPEILLLEKPGQTFTDEFANRRIAIDKGTVTSFVDSGKEL